MHDPGSAEEVCAPQEALGERLEQDASAAIASRDPAESPPSLLQAFVAFQLKRCTRFQAGRPGDKRELTSFKTGWTGEDRKPPDLLASYVRYYSALCMYSRRAIRRSRPPH